MSDKKVLIEVKDLCKSFGNVNVLNGISTEIAQGEVVAIIGPSGCGKSTFLKSLNRMNDLVEGCRITGEVKLGEQDIYGDIDIRRLEWYSSSSICFQIIP